MCTNNVQMNTFCKSKQTQYCSFYPIPFLYLRQSVLVKFYGESKFEGCPKPPMNVSVSYHGYQTRYLLVEAIAMS